MTTVILLVAIGIFLWDAWVTHSRVSVGLAFFAASFIVVAVTLK